MMPIFKMFFASMLLLAGFGCRDAKTEVGGLEWAETRQELKMELGQEMMVGSFAFKNISARPVAIGSVAVDCSCISSPFTATEYGPGDSGEVPFVFTAGARYGKETKTLLVNIAGRREPVYLKVEVDIPRVVEVLPAALRWKRGAAASEQAITVKFQQAYRVLRATSVHRAFDTRIVNLAGGRGAKILVTPKDTATIKCTDLIIETDSPQAAWRQLVCKLCVE